ncbi:MAG TPA: serine hydrolase, partial [Candidatus Acidoferrum sp.]|nr:serine hydrolase [Candidatus Acidoferrum sp.]
MRTCARNMLMLAALAIANRGAQAQDKRGAVDEVFSDLSKPGSPGCALAVARGGSLVYQKGYGLANIEERVSITPESVFDIGST